MMQSEIILQINNLNAAISYGNLSHIQRTLDDIERRNIWLRYIVIAEFLTANNGIMPTTSRPLQYENYAALAKKYIEILQGELYDLQNNYFPLSNKAINLMYGTSPYFQRNDILHEKNGRKLTVADVLSVIGYVKKAIDISGTNIDKKLSTGIDLALMALNTIDLALNNKKQDKPLNKALHLANDALSFALSAATEDERLGKYVEVSSLTIDLTIDFLIKE